MDALIPVRRRPVLTPLLTPLRGLPARPAAVKFHPGHYIWPSDLHRSQEANLRFFDSVGDNPYIKGFVIHFNWAFFEKAPGDYSHGFRVIDAYLEKAASLSKHLILHMADRSFGNPTTNVYPPYVINNGWVAVKPADQTWSGGLVSVPKLWQANVMDRLIALSRAYAARYDSHPHLAMYGFGESALALPATTGFSADALHRQVKRWFTESKKAWTHTPLRLNANYTRNDADMLDLFDHVSSAVVPGGAAIGGPDPELPLPAVTRTVQANRLFRGENPAGRDLRGAVPWVGEVRELGLGSRYTETPREIFDYFYHRMHVNYMIWLANTYVGGEAQRWPAILEFINSIKGKVYAGRPTVGRWAS